MKVYLLLLVSLLFGTSCSQRKNDKQELVYSKVSRGDDILTNNQVTHINIDFSKVGAIKYSDMFSDIRYKILNSPVGIILGKSEKIIETNGYYFIKSNGKIFIFDKKGDFYSKIDQKGEGPEQYRAITDFLVDTVSNKVEILDNHSFSIFDFDFKGKYLNNWKHGILSFQFEKISNNEYLFYSDKELALSYKGRYLLYDRNKNKVVNSYLPIDKRRIRYEAFLDINNFFKNNNEILISCSGNDTIFAFDDKKSHPKYIFNFGKYGINNSYFDKKLNSIVEFNEDRLKNNFAGLYYNSFSENDKILVTQIVRGKEVYYFLFDKKTKSYKLVNKFEDDINFKGEKITVASTFPTHFGSERAIRAIEPDAILNTLDSIKRNSSTDEWNLLLKTNPQMKILNERIKLESNPVLQIMTYK